MQKGEIGGIPKTCSDSRPATIAHSLNGWTAFVACCVPRRQLRRKEELPTPLPRSEVGSAVLGSVFDHLVPGLTPHKMTNLPAACTISERGGGLV